MICLGKASSKGRETGLNRGKAAGMMMNLYELIKLFVVLTMVMLLTEDKLYQCK